MESQERLQSGSMWRPGTSSGCSSISPDHTPHRSPSNWPNEWEAIYIESESSDWLSQSVASSTSWSDELEGDLTRSLQEQMQLIEHTLYRDGNQHLPAKSTIKEECRLWQKSFPHLRILGEGVKPSVGCQTRSRQEEIEEQIDEIIASHGEYSEDPSNGVLVKTATDLKTNEIYKEKIKKAVIDQIFARIWPDVVKKIEPLLREATKNQEVISVRSPELKNEESFDEDVTSGFHSLTLVEDLSLHSLRTRSGQRSGFSASKSVSTVPIKPVVLECSIAIPAANPLTARTSSAVRRSPGRLSQPSLTVKYPSPERLLSPLVLTSEVRPVKSAGGRKVKLGEKKQEARSRPQYDAKTGRMICRDETRSALRRNLKTSPSLPWSRHATLPPIETCEVLPRTVESKSKRSSSAFFRGGRLNSGYRPNTSLTAKNQMAGLSPLDSLQIRQSSIATSRHWLPDQHNYVNCEILQIRPSDQRQRWRNRSNIVKK